MSELRAEGSVTLTFYQYTLDIETSNWPARHTSVVNANVPTIGTQRWQFRNAVKDNITVNKSHICFTLCSDSSKGSYSKLSYVGADCRALPPSLAETYGGRALTLDLSYNRLTSLVGVDRFPRLEALVLDNNCLGDGLTLPRLPALNTLSLNKNNISNLESLLNQISRCLPSLIYLSVLGNAACPDQLSDLDADEQDYRAYRVYVVFRLPGLRFLDSAPVSAHERNEALCRGHLMRVIRPTRTTEEDEANLTALSSYTPLPTSRRTMGDHAGAYGKCRYRYSGKHSEGNRFIQNNDL